METKLLYFRGPNDGDEIVVIIDADTPKDEYMDFARKGWELKFVGDIEPITSDPCCLPINYELAR